MPTRSQLLLSTVLLFTLMFCTSQPAEDKPLAPKNSTLEELNAFLQQLSEKEALKHASIGFQLLSPKGKPLASLNSDKALSPASVLKVVTTASALEVLGADFRFETQLAYTGTLEQGVLRGDLVIRGGGDPSLGRDQLDALFRSWADKVAEAGIQKITGQVVGDASVFDSQLVPRTWIWEDMGNYYGAGASGLNIHENQYRLYFKPGAVGNIARVLRTNPKVPNLTFTNEMLTGKVGSGDQGYIFGAPFSSHRILRGSIPSGKAEFSIKGSLPDPAEFCAYGLQQALSRKSIPSSGYSASYSGVSERMIQLHSERSAPLAELVKKTNFKSINLYAEAFLKMIGKHQLGIGSTAKGIEAVEALWKKKGLDLSGFFLEDGSGLSRFSTLTAEQCAQLLHLMGQSPSFPAYFSSFPTAGKSGTLKRMLQNSTAYGKVHAKSGSMKRVRCYAGYVDRPSGQPMAFALLINNYSGKYSGLTKDIERLMELMAHLELAN